MEGWHDGQHIPHSRYHHKLMSLSRSHLQHVLHSRHHCELVPWFTLLVRMTGDAPLRSSSCITVRLPHVAASSNGVTPSLMSPPRSFMIAPWSSNSSTISRCPRLQASWSGNHPALSLTFTGWPCGMKCLESKITLIILSLYTERRVVASCWPCLCLPLNVLSVVTIVYQSYGRTWMLQ